MQFYNVLNSYSIICWQFQFKLHAGQIVVEIPALAGAHDGLHNFH